MNSMKVIWLVVNEDSEKLYLMSMNNGRRKTIPHDYTHSVGDVIVEIIKFEV